MDAAETGDGQRRADNGVRKGPRVSSASGSGSWRKMFMCCLKAEDDDVQVLDYEHSSLTDVPGEVFAHERTLEVLRLDCNQISDLPRPLFHCHGLKELYLSDNEIAQLPPALASLIHLQVLDVSKNALTEIPDAISGLKALSTLDLSVNPLGKLPEGATKLLSLESLNLSDTFLEFLPANFGRLTKLRLLELRENQLVTLPKSMVRLANLRRLDLGQNELSDVPEVVGSLPSLAELWMDGNKLDILPDFIGHLPNLTHLDASRNVLRGIAPSIGLCRSLTDLSLTSNNLVSLPEELGDLTQLVVLRVDDNQLVCLPDSIGRLTMLEELEAGQNQLTRLPPSIGLLRKLETLMLNENLLEELPSELGSCQRLTVLSVRKNKLERMPPEIGQLSRLRVVNLSCNRLQHLPVSFLKLPSLAALWLSEAQTKPVVPLQTDTDASSGHKVLTCFLLPQSAEDEERVNADRERSSPVCARSPTHIKFAFDGDADKLAGRLTRNPTPYPKELKALAKHAQHMQQHQQQPSSPTRTSVDAPLVDVHRPARQQASANAAAPSAAPSASAAETMETPVTVAPRVGVSSGLSASIVVSGSVADAPDGPVKSLPRVEVSPGAVSRAESLPPIDVNIQPRHSLVSNHNSSVPSGLEAEPPASATSDAPQRVADIEIKEARVMRPLKSTGDEKPDDNPSLNHPVSLPSPTDAIDAKVGQQQQPQQQQPPPYHVAAVYSKRAAEFNPAPNLPRTQSTDSGFTIDGVTNGKADADEDRDTSPSRDSGRGPSIEPLEEPASATNPNVSAAPAVVRRPSELHLNGKSDGEPDAALLTKRATYIIDDGTHSSPTNEVYIEENGPQSVAALRQAAREVFRSPRDSPLPPQKHMMWDPAPVVTNNGSAPLSAANVVGLPTSENSCPPLQPHAAAKIQGRIPQPKVSLTNGHHRDVTSPVLDAKSSQSVSVSRIPLSSHNRLPSGLPRQLSNLSNHSSQLNESSDSLSKHVPAPTLPPKKDSLRKDSVAPAPPTLLPKLSTSRIPPPQVHTPVLAVAPAAPLTPISGKTSFSPLPVHSARLVTPTTPVAAPLTPTAAAAGNGVVNNSKPTLVSSTSSTRIPLPKYSTVDLAAAKQAGPSPVSRIPTRLPTPTSTANPALKKLSSDLTDRSASPSLAAYPSRIH